MSVSKILLTCLDLYLFSFNNYGMSQNSFFAGFGIFRTSSRYLGPLSCWSPSWSASWWSSSSTTSRPGDLGSAKVFNDWQLIFAKVGASAQHNITSLHRAEQISMEPLHEVGQFVNSSLSLFARNLFVNKNQTALFLNKCLILEYYFLCLVSFG